MTATINGEARIVAEGATISDLLRIFALPARNVLVERNGEPVGRDSFDHERLQQGDQVEIINMVAGG